jgi:hypothetical protein
MTLKENFLRTRSENPLRLRFDTQADALAFAKETVERGRKKFVERWSPILENYAKGRLEYVVEVSVPGDVATLGNSDKFYFVFSAMPFPDIKGNAGSNPELAAINGRPRLCGQSYDTLMFVGAGHRKEPIEIAVPSFIGIQAHQISLEIDMDIAEPSFDFPMEVIDSLSNREMDPSGVIATEKHSCVSDALVQRMLEVAHDMIRIGANDIGEWLVQRDVDNLFAGCKIKIFPDGTDTIINETVDFPFDISASYFRVREH